MKNFLRTSCGVLFIALTALISTTSVAQSSNKTRYGIFSVKENIDPRLLAADNANVDYVRETQYLAKWDSAGNETNMSIDYWNARKKKIVLNIDNDRTPSAFPTNLTAYKNSLNSFLNVYASSIQLAVIENEELDVKNDGSGSVYHLGSMQDYINELTAAVNICNARGIPVADGGITPAILISLKNYYQNNNKQDSLNWLTGQVKGISNDSISCKRTDSLLNAFRQLPLTYVNLHWSEPVFGTSVTSGVVLAVCNYITQQTGKKVITNETSCKADSTIVTSLLKQWSVVNPDYCIFFDGEGTSGAKPLSSAKGDLLPTGMAFRNFVAGAQACKQSMGISPSGLVYGCQGNNIKLTADAGFTNYQWSTGETTRIITVKATGNYSVISSRPNCKVYSNATALLVNVLPAKPTVTPNTSPTLDVCPSKNVQLSASTGLTHLWNTGDTTKNINVKTSGSYFVTVSDKNGCKNSSDKVITTFQSCTAPSSLSVSDLTTNRATLNWGVIPCSVGYQLQYRVLGVGDWTTAQIVNGNSSSRIIYGLVPAIYEWRMLNYCQYSPDTLKSAYTKGGNFTIVSPLLKVLNSTASTLNNTFEASIFPVPATTSTTVSITHISEDLKIMLVDVYGKILWQKENIKDANTQIPVNNLAGGIYMVIVKDKNHSKTLRLIKE